MVPRHRPVASFTGTRPHCPAAGRLDNRIGSEKSFLGPGIPAEGFLPLCASCRNATLGLVQNSKDQSLREAGDLDRSDLIAREHFGGIAGVPDIHGEWTKPFCRTQGIRGLRIRAAYKRQ